MLSTLSTFKQLSKQVYSDILSFISKEQDKVIQEQLDNDFVEYVSTNMIPVLKNIILEYASELAKVRWHFDKYQSFSYKGKNYENDTIFSYDGSPITLWFDDKNSREILAHVNVLQNGVNYSSMDSSDGDFMKFCYEFKHADQGVQGDQGNQGVQVGYEYSFTTHQLINPQYRVSLLCMLPERIFLKYKDAVVQVNNDIFWDAYDYSLQMFIYISGYSNKDEDRDNWYVDYRFMFEPRPEKSWPYY